MKYNKSEIMKNAWNLYRTFNKKHSFGHYLKIAWDSCKHTHNRPSFEVVSGNTVIARHNNEETAYKECHYRNKVFFNQHSFVREVCAA